MEDKTQQYEEIIEPSMQHISVHATAMGIPFITVFQVNDDHFILSHNIGEDAHNEMKQNVQWWTDYLDGKYDNETIVTEEDMKRANTAISNIIEYVQGKGFKALVAPEDEYSTWKRLRIWKVVGRDRVHVDWHVSIVNMARSKWRIWQYLADCNMQKVDEAIEKGPPPIITEEQEVSELSNDAIMEVATGALRRPDEVKKQ